MKLLDAKTSVDAVKLVVFMVVTSLATGVLVVTIGNLSFGATKEYKAVFSDTTGLNTGDDVRIAFSERMAAEPAAVVGDLFGWLDIDPDVAGSITYSVENRTVPVRSATLQRLALALNDEALLGRHRRLKEPLRKVYYALNRRPEPEQMERETRRMLEELFEPGNAALAQRLRGLGYTELPGWLSAGADDERVAR